MSHPSNSHGSLRLRRGTSRRDVLKYALGSAGIAALGPVVGRRLPTAYGAPMGNKVLVIVYLDGGCDTLNAVVPHTLPNYYSRRPTIAIPSASALPLTGGPGNATYRLHPAFDGVQALWNAGDVAIAHKVGYPTPNLSHFESQDIFAQGVRGSFGPLGIPESGWIARYAEQYAPTPMGAVALGAGRPLTFVGGSSNPLQVGSLSSFNYAGDGSFSNNHAYRLKQVQQVLANATTVGTPGDVRDAIDQAQQLSGQVQAALASYNTYLSGSGVTYPSNNSLANRLKDVAALLYGGFETRVFYTTTGGFDTHGAENDVNSGHPALFNRLDNAITAFAADMKAMGQWNNVVLAVYTEFGRRNYENGSAGTDHAGPFDEMLIGGAVNGGMYGNDHTDAQLLGEYPAYEIDFRDVWKEILNDHLGANPTPVFPESQPISTTLGVV